MLATFIDEPERVTSAQMDRWCRDFDNWAIVDTACFALFDRTPHAWAKMAQWARSRDEFVKRAAFALLWSLTVHDRVSGDQPFLRALALIERGAADDRHFVSKAVNMALRATSAVLRSMRPRSRPLSDWRDRPTLRRAGLGNTRYASSAARRSSAGSRRSGSDSPQSALDRVYIARSSVRFWRGKAALVDARSASVCSVASALPISRTVAPNPANSPSIRLRQMHC